MDAFELFTNGRFAEAVDKCKIELARDPNNIGYIDGLSHSYQGLGDFRSAIPLMERVHEHERRNPDHPGQNLYLAVAYWCLEDRSRAIDLVRSLCSAILDGSISMAPDHAGGATFGLILHFMAVTAGDSAARDDALKFLQTLNVKFDKRPTLFRYPVATVKQLLGEVRFEDALASATGARNLAAAHRTAKSKRLTMLALGQVLFHDGATRRANGDEYGCKERMKEVFALGYQTDSVCWYLARHEVT